MKFNSIEEMKRALAEYDRIEAEKKKNSNIDESNTRLEFEMKSFNLKASAAEEAKLQAELKKRQLDELKRRYELMQEEAARDEQMMAQIEIDQLQKKALADKLAAKQAEAESEKYRKILMENEERARALRMQSQQHEELVMQKVKAMTLRQVNSQLLHTQDVRRTQEIELQRMDSLNRFNSEDLMRKQIELEYRKRKLREEEEELTRTISLIGDPFKKY